MPQWGFYMSKDNRKARPVKLILPRLSTPMEEAGPL